MIRRILNHDILSNFVEQTCCENGVCVNFADDVDQNDVVIIKVDNYYNSLNLNDTPPSIDCLIIRRCIGGGYGLTLIELKNITSGQSFDLENLKGKFHTTIYDFIKGRFREILDVHYNEVKLYFVTNIDVYKRDIGLKMELLMNVKYDFNGKKYMVRPEMPNPAIKNCYN